jgi:hypothetical protein
MKINKMLLLLALSCIAFINPVEATFIYLRNEFGKPITYRTSSHSEEATILYHAIQVVGSDYSPEQLEWNLEIKSRSSFFSSIKKYIKKVLKREYKNLGSGKKDLVIIINPTNPLKFWSWNITHSWQKTYTKEKSRP